MPAEENLRMSVKEADRLGVMRQMDKKAITSKKASEELGISLKQLARIRKRYLQEGERGLISRKKGLPSGNKIAKKIRDRVLDLLRTTYSNFGPTFASETLSERNQLKISHETLRKWMIEEGLWKAKRKKDKRAYQRRPRRSRFGELLQGDGSPEDWFEGRSEKCCLVHFIDDATNKITSGRFMPTETTEGYLECLKGHLETYGRPLGLYVDKHGIFKVNREELKKGIGITHFGRVLQELGITLICAHSPQAKGRIERSNGVLQDRLIKEMRLEKINSIEEANEFLPRFLEKHNKRFEKKAASQEDAHRPMRVQDDLEKIFARKDKRRVSKDLMFQHRRTLYLIETKTPNRLRHATIEVLWREDKLLKVEYQGKELKWKKWEDQIYEEPKVVDAKEIGLMWIDKKQKRGSLQHPWR